jgi:ornithine carbamoyltransferase
LATFKGRDFLTLADYTPNEITQILKQSLMLARQRRLSSKLKGKNIAMIFQKPSTRTRASFETAIAQLGGHPINLSWNEMQLGRGETIHDTAKVLDRYVNAVMARVFAHEDLEELARHARVPIINGLSDKHHPCQILADLLTLLQHKRRLKGIKLAYVGDGNNVCNSLLIGCAKTGVNINAATPRAYRPDTDSVRQAEEAALDTGAEIQLTEDPEAAVKGADAIYTDTFVSMGSEKEKGERLQAFLPKYQVNQELISKAKPDAIFLHCLPAHRGEEVTGQVIDGPNSVVWDEAENRLHTSKALLTLLV